MSPTKKEKERIHRRNARRNGGEWICGCKSFANRILGGVAAERQQASTEHVRACLSAIVVTSASWPYHGTTSRNRDRTWRTRPSFDRRGTFRTLRHSPHNTLRNIRPRGRKAHSAERTRLHRACSTQHSPRKDACTWRGPSCHLLPGLHSDENRHHTALGNRRRLLRISTCGPRVGCLRLTPQDHQLQTARYKMPGHSSFESFHPGNENRSASQSGLPDRLQVSPR
jgi:hypothetical protein